MSPAHRKAHIDQLLSRVEPGAHPHDCWEWHGNQDKDGYGRLKLSGVETRAPRVSYELFRGAVPDGHFVLHHCDNPPCCNPAHLYAGTPKQNAMDRVRRGRGRTPRGEAVHFAKLSESDVRRIRELYAAGLTQYDIAAKFGVEQTNISLILRRVTWRHVSDAGSNN